MIQETYGGASWKKYFIKTKFSNLGIVQFSDSAQTLQWDFYMREMYATLLVTVTCTVFE